MTKGIHGAASSPVLFMHGTQLYSPLLRLFKQRSQKCGSFALDLPLLTRHLAVDWAREEVEVRRIVLAESGPCLRYFSFRVAPTGNEVRGW